MFLAVIREEIPYNRNRNTLCGIIHILQIMQMYYRYIHTMHMNLQALDLQNNYHIKVLVLSVHRAMKQLSYYICGLIVHLKD
jgi:hypothetical protein